VIRGLPLLPLGQIPVPDCRDLDVDIDPIEQGAGDPGAVALDLGDRTRALMLGVAVKTTGTTLRNTSYTPYPFITLIFFHEISPSMFSILPSRQTRPH
jgi:hypothetical protein